MFNVSVRLKVFVIQHQRKTHFYAHVHTNKVLYQNVQSNHLSSVVTWVIFFFFKLCFIYLYLIHMRPQSRLVSENWGSLQWSPLASRCCLTVFMFLSFFSRALVWRPVHERPLCQPWEPRCRPLLPGPASARPVSSRGRTSLSLQLCLSQALAHSPRRLYKPALKSQLQHLPAGGPSAGCSPSLGLSFLTCKIEQVLVSNS